MRTLIALAACIFLLIAGIVLIIYDQKAMGYYCLALLIITGLVAYVTAPLNIEDEYYDRKYYDEESGED